MQKLGTIAVISGILIVIGLILLVIGNQVILEGISQENGKISSSYSITISTDLDTKKTTLGVFAIQIIDFKDNTIFVKILDPSDIEIVSLFVSKETIEKEFDVLETGIYKLIIESNSNEETHVFGAIGPLPDSSKKLLGLVSVSILVIGMVGMVGIGLNGIKNRKKSI